MTQALPPCPLCNSDVLNRFSHWTALDDGMKEIVKIQCTACHCEASVEAWSKRTPGPGRVEWLLIEALREEEGSDVTLVCDNPDFNGQPNNKVECNGGWTDWEPTVFTGDTISEALMAAYLKMTGGAVAPAIVEASNG